MKCVLCFIALLVASGTTRAGTVYRFDVVNASTRTIVTVAVAPAGGQIFRKAVDVGHKPVKLQRGEIMTITTQPSEGGCLRDIQIILDDHRETIERSFDVCRRDASYRAAP